MEFGIICLGTDLHKHSYGGFSDDNGSWDCFKCFYDGAFGYGEFYLNINFKEHKAELEAKDGDYARLLTQAFYHTMSMEEVFRLGD